MRSVANSIIRPELPHIHGNRSSPSVYLQTTVAVNCTAFSLVTVHGQVAGLVLHDSTGKDVAAQILSIGDITMFNMGGNITTFMMDGDKGHGVMLAASPDRAVVDVTDRPFSASGKARSVSLSTSEEELGLSLTDANGNGRADLVLTDNGPAIAFFDDSRNPRVLLTATDSRQDLEWMNRRDSFKRNFAVGSYTSTLNMYGFDNPNKTPLALLTAEGDGGKLRVSDKAGFEAIVGSESLTTPTGIHMKSSAATIALTDKSGHAIWSAP